MRGSLKVAGSSPIEETGGCFGTVIAAAATAGAAEMVEARTQRNPWPVRRLTKHRDHDATTTVGKRAPSSQQAPRSTSLFVEGGKPILAPLPHIAHPCPERPIDLPQNCRRAKCSQNRRRSPPTLRRIRICPPQGQILLRPQNNCQMLGGGGQLYAPREIHRPILPFFSFGKLAASSPARPRPHNSTQLIAPQQPIAKTRGQPAQRPFHAASTIGRKAARRPSSRSPPDASGLARSPASATRAWFPSRTPRSPAPGCPTR